MPTIDRNKVDVNCPQCGLLGCSIASINNREHYIQEYAGSIGSSVVGLGSGGMGIGVGSSKISLDGTKRSKRAELFSEPQKPEKESIDYYGYLLPFFVPIMFAVAVKSDLFREPEYLTNILISLSVIVSLLAVMLRVIGGCSEEEGYIESNYQKALFQYKKQIKAYNSIRYCESCNVIFENEHNILEIANADGYKNALKLLR